VCVYLEKDGLQLSTVFSKVLLREEDCVCWDAVVRHPAVTLQHPYHNVWKTVLGLRETAQKGKIKRGKGALAGICFLTQE